MSDFLRFVFIFLCIQLFVPKPVTALVKEAAREGQKGQLLSRKIYKSVAYKRLIL